MISARLDYVFSGEDDQAVILPLPLAFLRLIASSVYTYEIQWNNQDWEAEDPTSEQLSIIEGALSAVALAADGIGLEQSSVIQLPTGLTVYNQSGTNSNPPQIQILKSAYPDLAEASVLIGHVKSTLDLDRWLTMFKYGSATNQWLQSLPVGSNRFNQLMIPMDATGAKINVQGFDTLAYWTIQIQVSAYLK